MISVDSNIIFSALAPREASYTVARKLLREVNGGGLVLSPLVYAELMASPNRKAVVAFLELSKVDILWEMPSKVWQRAGIASGEYARGRRKGQLPRRLVADFLIGAHAEYHMLAVLTFDDTVFRAAFPEVRLIEGASN